jgi:hypothetical protein
MGEKRRGRRGKKNGGENSRERAATGAESLVAKARDADRTGSRGMFL